MDAVKNTLSKTTNFVARHKTKIAVAVTAATAVVVTRKIVGTAVENHAEFLTEKGLLDEYQNWIANNAE